MDCRLSGLILLQTRRTGKSKWYFFLIRVASMRFIMILILVTDPMPIRLGVLTIKNRGASFSNFRRGQYVIQIDIFELKRTGRTRNTVLVSSKQSHWIKYFNYTRLYSVKSPNVQEAERLASYKRGRVVKKGVTDKITAELNVHRPGRLTTWPCSPCLPLHLCVRFPLRCDVKWTYLSL